MKNNSDSTLIDDEIINQLNNMMKGSKNIECKTFTKTIEYSKIKYIQDDLEIARKEDFCEI